MLSISLICAGVTATSISESVDSGATDIVGVIASFMGALVASLYGMWIETYAIDYSLSSFQLIYNIAPLSTILLLPIIPFFDTPLTLPIPDYAWGMLLLSAALAVVLNLTLFLVIHDTDAVAGTVVLHAKTLFIVGLGWLGFGGASQPGLMGVVG